MSYNKYFFKDLPNNFYTNKINDVRPGCKDIWNSFMTVGATYGKHDIPFCPTTADSIPSSQITWEEAKQIHRKNISQKNRNYHVDAFINWYIDDYKFDSSKGIWHDYKNAYKIIKHFEGVITPDFSTYQDFPEPYKIFATYRMRAYGYWLGKLGIKVINNVRWGTEESFDYSFEGIPTNSIVCIGTVGGGPRKLVDRERFEVGLLKMIEVLHPITILVYGSAYSACFVNLKERGINVISYPSRTAKAFNKRKYDE